MGWTMTRISGFAQGIFKARMQWIDGISSARRSMEQFVHAVWGHARASPQFNAAIEAQLMGPLYTQCLGYDVPRVKRAPTASPAGWVGAAQVGPFAQEDAGDLSDEDKEVGSKGVCTYCMCPVCMRRRLVRCPSFVDLMGAAEQMEQCTTCGTAPCWMHQGNAKVAGGLCCQCTSGLGGQADRRHCSNCGEMQALHQWVMIAVHPKKEAGHPKVSGPSQ